MQIYKSLDIVSYMDAMNQLHATKFYFPEKSSKLMEHKGSDYVHMLEIGKVLPLTRAQVNACPYAMEITNMNDKLVCFALIQRCKELKLVTYSNFEEQFGFDVKYPPNQTYTLYMLYQIDSVHPLFKNQPLKSTNSVTVVQKEALVKTLMKNKTIEGYEGVVVDQAFKLDLAIAASSYYFYKFEVVKHEKNRAHYLKMASTSSAIREIVKEFQPDDIKQITKGDNDSQMIHE